MNLFKTLKALPGELLELFMFFAFVSAGAIVKMIRQKEAGVKMTAIKILAETFTSFFIAGIVYAVFGQFLDFEPFFTYAMCSLAGSMSTKITQGVEGIIDTGFEKGKSVIKNIKL